jgi:hypothetical protein
MGRATGKSETVEKSRTRIPDRLTDHFSRALDNRDKLMQIARLSAQGISMHLGRPKVIQVLRKIKGDDESVGHIKQLQQAEADAALAREEIDQGYPVLNGFVTIAMWSWLEDFVKGLAASWLVYHRPAIRSPSVAKLKVRLGDYVTLSRHEQALHIVEILDQEIGSGLRNGINRFEGLLDGLGLKFNLNEESKKNLFEFQMIRNNLAHRNGLVDQKLWQACPWIGLKIGQPVKVSRKIIVHAIGRVGLISRRQCSGRSISSPYAGARRA